MVDRGAVNLAFGGGLGMGKNPRKAVGAARRRAVWAWEQISGLRGPVHKSSTSALGKGGHSTQRWTSDSDGYS